MKVSHIWLQTYFEKKIPDAEKMERLFPLSSFEIEGLEKIKDGAGNAVDTVIDAKILPDRAHYALSHKGIAKEISFLTKMAVRDRFADGLPATIDTKPSIKIEGKGFCRRYIGRIVELKPLDKAPKWLIDALTAIGQRSIDPIVDATNYVMYDIGQPLHAFDAEKVKGGIVIRAAKEGEDITLLDGKKITLTTGDNVIADDEGPLVVAGAKGGKRAEISRTTKKIIIESANFDPTAVRRTSTKYDIRSDSSKRFENEITPELAIHGMHNACALIKEMMPDARFGPIVDEYPIKAEQMVIEFDPVYLEERLGIKIPLDEAGEILKRMDIQVQETDHKTWILAIPYERLDLNIKEDIVEEIGRIYGYDHIKGVLPPKTSRQPEILPMYCLCEKIRNILVEAGFSEVSLYALTEKGDFEMVKPLAKDKAFARKNLTDGMMACVEKNALNADLLGLEAIKIFEIGHVFSETDGEKIKLAVGAAQVKRAKGLKSENIIDTAIKLLAADPIIGSSFASAVKPIQKGSHSVCEIDLSKALKAFKPDFSYKDLDFAPASKNLYQRFSLYPFIVRDIAVFVPESISSETVWEAIEKGIAGAEAEGLLARRSLFDVFKKNGRVSYAFRMIFQSMERTLTDGEANKIMEKIDAQMKENGWEVR